MAETGRCHAMRCIEADRLRGEWYSFNGSPYITDAYLAYTRLTDHVISCPACRELMRRDTEAASAAVMPEVSDE